MAPFAEKFITPYIEKAERYIINHLDSASTMLIILGIVGTITSSIAQRIWIKGNKKIPDDTKEFLINQEKKDCLLSAGLTWLTGTASKQAIHALTEHGYLLNNSIRQYSDRIAILHDMTHKELAKNGFFKTTGENLPKLNIGKYGRLKGNFTRCQEGLSVIATIATGILTTNLLVPFLRNKLAKPAEGKIEQDNKSDIKFIPYNIPSTKLTEINYRNYYTGSIKI